MARDGEGAAPEIVAAAARAHTLGKYRLVAELARGGMGVVYLALMRGPGGFNKLLVLKELKAELLEDPAALQMFLEEARLAACLSHPNVVQTLEAGSDGHRHYIAMEYLDGQSLHRVLSRARRSGAEVPFEWHASVLCAALEGLAYAHSARDYDGQALNIVHRDVSPHNVFIGYDGQVKVLDFGIAKAMSSSVDTRTGILKGKVAYMAPEQASGGVVDARADLFSVGVMLWEAASGRRFWAELGNEMQILRTLLRGEMKALTHASVDMPDEVRAITDKATALDPAQRQPSAAAMQAELRAVLSRAGGPWAPAEMGQVLQELFAEDRVALQADIEQALSHYRGPHSGEYSLPEVQALATDAEVPSVNVGVASVRMEAMSGHMAAASGGPGTMSGSMAAASGNVRIAPEETPPRIPQLWERVESTGISLTSLSPPGPSKREVRKSGRGWAFGFGALALCAGGGVAAWHVLGRAPSLLPGPAEVVPETPAVVAAPAAPAVSERARLVVRASPPQARIVVDRGVAFENPAVTTLPKDGATHSVHVEADGFVPQDLPVEASGDATLIVTLEAKKASTRGPAPARAAAPLAAPAPAAPVVATTTAAPSPPPPPQTPAPAPGAPQRRINASNPYSH